MKHYLPVSTVQGRCQHLEAMLREAQDSGVPKSEGYFFIQSLRHLLPEWTEDDRVQVDLRSEAHYRRIGEPFPPDTKPYFFGNAAELADRLLVLLSQRDDAPTDEQVATWMPTTLLLAQEHRAAMEEERRLERGL